MSTLPIKTQFLPTNTPTASDFIPNKLGRINFGNNQRVLQLSTDDIIQKASNSGNVKPYSGPTARSLFYNAATYDKESSIYGQFLFYSIVGNHDERFFENYYLSERTEYNSKVSSVNSISGASRNPSAGFLVRQTQSNIGSSNPDNGSQSKNYQYSFGKTDTGSYIMGGGSAPYFWKDFLYCKYYGHIPNNYMITLRRYPSPMKDNLSLPDSIKNTDIYKLQGAGKPVAQAITWWGGNTGNTLNSIIGFSTGLKWDPVQQKDRIDQTGFSNGIFNILNNISNGTNTYGLGGEDLANIKQVTDVLVSSTDSGFSETTEAAKNYFLRDRAETQIDGPLSKFIWTSVDTIDEMTIRARGLKGAGSQGEKIDLKFHYELTSAGEVNTKAAMADIIGNLLGLCTNYGNFLSPEIRYNNQFPAIQFPGGDEGLANFYANPLKWFNNLTNYIKDPSQNTNGDPSLEAISASLNKVNEQKNKIQGAVSSTQNNLDISGGFENIGKTLGASFLRDIVFPSAVLTGIPTGEWHLVVGNPCNPIAMIGNLICEDLRIDFGEVLGPDDFPTELTATITLSMARPRERGEIESMFNRGEGRLYQSVQPTYSNSQSIGAVGTVNGNVVVNPNEYTTNFNNAFGPENSSEYYLRDE